MLALSGLRNSMEAQAISNLLLLLSQHPLKSQSLTPFSILEENSTDFIVQEDGTSLITIEGT